MSKIRDEWAKAKATAEKAGVKFEDKLNFGPLLDKYAAAEVAFDKGSKALATKPDQKKETALRKNAFDAAGAASGAGGRYGLILKGLRTGPEEKLHKPAADLSAALTRILNVLQQGRVRYKV